MTTCKNCGQTFEGAYCSRCTQSAATTRITWYEIFLHIRKATVDVDHGFLFTMRELFLRPGLTIRSYLEGKRVNYANPFFYVLLLAGFSAILFLTFDVPLPVRSIHLENIERSNPLMAQKYFVLVGLFIIVLTSLSDWLLYHRMKYNLPELVISNAFQAGQILVITLLVFPLLYLQDHNFPATSPWMDIRLALKAVIFFYLVSVRYRLFAPASQSRGLLMAITLIQIVSIILIHEFVVSRLIMKLV